jgi:uncharacterized protein YxjI
MKLIIRQKIVSWFDSYNVYDENGNVVYIIKGKLAWGHKFVICDANGIELGCINERIITFLPEFEIYKNNLKVGAIKQKLSVFKPKYTCDLNDYEIDGDFLGLNYEVKKSNNVVATVTKKFFSITDTYTIDCQKEDAFNILLIVVAIDAVNCGNNS